ncbi:MAG: carboxylating nicotinate-nucleotide diphosphorylase [Thermoplasmata archaeon]|nr:carboxylating nicotinate-nucleotide diphosphorylase [Thermoplasmata archaeon]
MTRRPPRLAPTPVLTQTELDRIVRVALREDRADRDLTTHLVLPTRLQARGVVIAQARGVLSGIRPATRTAERLGLRVEHSLPDGSAIRSGDRVLEVRGDARAILAAERTMLNFLMHLSGVATSTAEAVRRAGSARRGVQVRATRKTLPGLRVLEKLAVIDGGGDPHRQDLASAALVKNTHLDLLGSSRWRVLEQAIQQSPEISWTVEVRSAAEARRAVAAGVRSLLLDNAGPSGAKAVLRTLRDVPARRRITVELSGGITHDNVAAHARTGANSVSLGAITHSAPALPFHLEIRRVAPRRASR